MKSKILHVVKSQALNEQGLSKMVWIWSCEFGFGRDRTNSAIYGDFTLETEKIELFLKSVSHVKSLKELYKYIGALKSFDEAVASTISFLKYQEMFRTTNTITNSDKDKRTCYNC